MITVVNGLHGCAIRALDGEVGSVDEVLFDDEHWTVRYLIVDTGNWLSGRKVLISPMAFGALDWDRRALNVSLTREQIQSSPDIVNDEPVSRQWERTHYDYYGWPYYWGGMGVWGSCYYPGALFAQSAGKTEQERVDDRARDHARARDRVDAHLRSTKEVTGYRICATDGHLGHVHDFVVIDATWRVCYLAVDTRDWWPGKKVLLPPEWIDEVNWPDRTVTVSVTQDQVRGAPEWDDSQPISSRFEDQLYSYYARQRPVCPPPPGLTERHPVSR